MPHQHTEPGQELVEPPSSDVTLEPGGLTGLLAGCSARRPWRVIGAWLALATVCAFAYFHLDQELTSRVELLDEPPSARASNLIQSRLAGSEVATSVFCTVQHDAPEAAALGPLPSSPGMADVSAVVADIRSCLNTENSAGLDQIGAPAWQASFEPELMTQLQLIGTPRETASEAVSALYTLLEARQDGMPGGEANGQNLHDRLATVAKEDLRQADTIGVLVAVLVLILVVRAVAPSVIPLLVSAAAILTALGITLLFRSILPVSLYVVNIIVMFGLAVGIDYSLL